MKKNLFLIIFTLLISGVNSQSLHHKLHIELIPEKGIITAIDTIYLQKHFSEGNKIFYFKLNKNLQLKCLSEEFLITKITDKDTANINTYSSKYKIEIAEAAQADLIIPIFYEGIIKDKKEKQSLEYARGFSETKGKISTEGIYLAGSSFWVPYFNNQDLISFTMNVKIDSAWSVVSQGKRTMNIIKFNKKIIRYESPEPMDEIYLNAAKWTEYSLMADEVLVQAFLRTPDKKLAYKYLGVTSHYIKLYESLIGKYPYTKFALVENFWQTGYGMPSFTLLGDKIIRFPWILHSSYPHELLHNYWGNSVYVDYEQGNWCEGITVYMADHLIKEQQGKAADYRRTALKNFTDYVNPDNDFPVKEFISRSNSATEAIGYGKCMMFNNMLREKVGDKIFLEAYAKFYKDYKFKKASFADILTCFNEVSDMELDYLFEQWLSRKGAPKIEITKVDKTENALNFTLLQTQKEEVFDIDIPIAIYYYDKSSKKDDVYLMKENLNEREKEFTIDTKNITRIEVDPQFNIFRRLDSKEVPITLSQLYGSTDGLIILPKKCPYVDEYIKLAETWEKSQKAQKKNLDIVYDTEIKKLPKDKTIWIIGYENLFLKYVVFSREHLSYFSEKDEKTIKKLKTQGSLVYAISNPENEKKAIGFIGTREPEAISGLIRKLPHYGKYSYLGFEGNSPANVMKGTFPALNSPLHIQIDEDSKTKANLKARKALEAK